MKFLKGKERDDDLVKLAAFNSSAEAHSVRVLLEAHGIHATVHNEESITMFGASMFGQPGPIGFEVMVQRQHLEEAKLIQEVPRAAEILIPDWTCACGETVDKGFSVCWCCGQEFASEEEV